MSILLVLLVSLLLQSIAAILAIRLIWATNRRLGWGMVAGAAVILAARRAMILYRMHFEGFEPDLLNEIYALLISSFQVVGFVWIAPPFRISAEKLLQNEIDRFLGGPVVVFQWRPKPGWPVDYVSPNVGLLFDRTPDDFLSGRTPYASVLHPDDLERVGREVALHTADGARSFEQDYRIVQPDGSIRWLYDYTVITRRKDGSVRHYSGYVIDVSERQRAAEEQAQLAAIVESSEDAILRISADGTIQSWNASAARLYGYTAEEVIGHPVSMLAPAERALQWEGVLNEMKRGLRIGRLETERLTRTGEELPVTLTVSPMRDEKGVFVGASLIARDIAEKRQTETALRDSEERFHAFMNNIPAPTFMKDEEGRLVYANPAFEREFGQEGIDWRGKTDADLWPRELARTLSEHDRLVLRSRKALAMEESLEVGGVTRRWLVVRFTFTDAGGQTMLAGVALDANEPRA